MESREENGDLKIAVYSCTTSTGMEESTVYGYAVQQGDEPVAASALKKEPL